MKPAFINQPLPFNTLRWNLTMNDQAPTTAYPLQLTPMTFFRGTVSPSSPASELAPIAATRTPMPHYKKFPGVLYISDSEGFANGVSKQSTALFSVKEPMKSRITTDTVHFFALNAIDATTVSPFRKVLNTTIRASAKADLIIRPSFMSKSKAALVIDNGSGTPTGDGSSLDYAPAFNQPPDFIQFQGNLRHRDTHQ